MKPFLLTIPFLFLFIFESNHCFAQNQFILKGKITEQKTKELIPFANLFDSTYNIHATSDMDGNFELQLKEGIYHFEISSVGYQTIYKEINLTQNTELMLQLQQDVHLEEVTVTSEKLSKTAEMNTWNFCTWR